jgi:chemotaxis protein MotB
MRYFLSLVILFSSTLAQAQSSGANFPAPSELYEGILALSCIDNDPNGEVPETLIITETNGEFQIVNAPNIDSVTKNKNGFVFKSSTDEEFLGFIKKNNGKWSIEFLSADGMLQGTCVEEALLVRNIVTAIAPKILENANSLSSQLSSLTLELNDQRKKAEETLALLAAAQSVEKTLYDELTTALLGLEAARLVQARSQDELKAVSASDAASRQKLQTAVLRLEMLKVALQKAQDELKVVSASDAASREELQTALWRLEILKVALQKAEAIAQNSDIDDLRSALSVAIAVSETAERQLTAAESFESYKTDFFGSLRGLLEDFEGVNIVGDRFVFSSEVLFASGRAELTPAGRKEISKVASILKDVTEEIPQNIDWVLQVDGHTDDQPILPGSHFQNNWELSQARALSVVLYLVTSEQMPPRRLSANGFGEYQPINPANTRDARAQNRRIELKLTEK